MAKFIHDFDVNVDDIIILDDIEVRRHLDTITSFRSDETKINLCGHTIFVDALGNTWDPMYDDQKGAKEDWEAGLLED